MAQHWLEIAGFLYLETNSDSQEYYENFNRNHFVSPVSVTTIRNKFIAAQSHFFLKKKKRQTLIGLSGFCQWNYFLWPPFFKGLIVVPQIIKEHVSSSLSTSTLHLCNNYRHKWNLHIKQCEAGSLAKLAKSLCAVSQQDKSQSWQLASWQVSTNNHPTLHVGVTKYFRTMSYFMMQQMSKTELSCTYKENHIMNISKYIYSPDTG